MPGERYPRYHQYTKQLRSFGGLDCIPDSIEGTYKVRWMVSAWRFYRSGEGAASFFFVDTVLNTAVVGVLVGVVHFWG